MKDSSPAWQIRPKDEVNNAKAIRRLLAEEPAPVRVVEFFGGLGRMTKLLRELWPETPIEAWDLDDMCLRFLGRIPGVRAVKGDSLEECEVKPGDGVLMDFNLWTVKRAEKDYLPVMERVFSSDPAWVEVTDSAMSKMPINFRSYGLASASKKAYLELGDAYGRRFGYRLANTATPHSRTVMLLFKPLAQKKTRPS